MLGSLILLGFCTSKIEGGDGNVEGKLGLIPTMKAIEMALSRCVSAYREKLLTDSEPPSAMGRLCCWL